MADVDSNSWKVLADKKEKEWKGILESRVAALEATIKEKDKDLESQKEKFVELKEHFKYNFKLLDERDRELERYDATYADIRTTVNSKNAEISELKIQLDDLKNVIKREEKSRDDLQVNYQRRLREKQAEVDSYKSSKDGELNEERKEYEDFRRKLQHQLTSLHNELDTQRRELTTEFDHQLKKREHEFRVQSDELHAKVLEHDLKAKLLHKELELCRESGEKTSATARQAELGQRECEKLIKQKDWEIADLCAVKDSRISELEHKLLASEAAMTKNQEDFQRKYTEMDRMARDKEEMIERAKNGYLEKEKAFQESCQDLQSKLEDAQIKERQLSWSIQDITKEKDLQIEKLQEEVRDVKDKWDRHVTEISRNNVTRDLELSSALEEQRRLKLELEQRKEDVQRYKSELKASADRESQLDRSRAQTELDWQRRCEDVEAQHWGKSEDLISKLTQAKKEALALVKERDRELQHKIYLVKSLHKERDQLRQLLQKHDIPLDQFVKYSLDTAEEEEHLVYVEDLQKQNSNLKQLIGEMRSQMETLGHAEGNANTNAVKEEDSWLKEDLTLLRKENRELREKLKKSQVKFSSTGQKLVDNPEILSQVDGNSCVKNHILALNEAIGELRSEKVELSATAKKQQARIAHLEANLETISTQPRQKQIEIDQLGYELTSQRRRHEVEVTGLRSRVSDLEQQLSESRREADEFHRQSLERNQELVALGNQLSSLKLEMSEANPSVNFGAQELYIQQLQTELSQLRRRASSLEDNGGVVGDVAEKLHQLGDSGQADLRYKLKSAAAKIVQLAKENHQLTESNNRLRAQMKQLGNIHEIDNAKENKGSFPRDIGQKDNKSRDFDGRLSQLEKLQYELTRQELQYAHRFTSTNNKSLPGQHQESGSRESTPLHNAPPKQVQVISAREPISPPANRRTRGAIDPHMLMSMSSGGGESIQKVWQMLDESVTSGDPGSSPPSPRTQLTAYNRSSTGQSGHSADSSHGKGQGQTFQLAGHPVGTDKSNNRPVGRTAALKYAENVRKQTQIKPKDSKVRNYNFKDDTNNFR